MQTLPAPRESILAQLERTLASDMFAGAELVYRTDDRRLMVVDYQVKNGASRVGKPREWTPVRLGDTGLISNFDVDPGGDRILGLLPAPGEEAERIRNQVTVMPRFADEVLFLGENRLACASSTRPRRPVGWTSTYQALKIRHECVRLMTLTRTRPTRILARQLNGFGRTPGANTDR